MTNKKLHRGLNDAPASGKTTKELIEMEQQALLEEDRQRAGLPH